MDPSAAAEWTPPKGWGRFVAIDSHTGGEPFRVIVSGLPDIPGGTMLERRRHAMTTLDPLRRALMWEPRGHMDMYGGWIGPPATTGADISVLFTHNEGFSTMCGHGIIALTKVVFDTGIIETDDGTLVIDTPAGVITARAAFEGGAVSSVSFINVPSFVAGPLREIEVKGFGTVLYRLSFGGAFYAYVDVTAIGLTMESASALVRAGKAIKRAVVTAGPISHPLEEDLGFLYGVVFTGPPRNPENHSSHACVFADGELDRSPTGTGVSGRLAILNADGEVTIGEDVRIESLVGSVFTGRIVDTTQVGSEAAVIPEVTGTAHITGRSEFWLDPSDEIGAGFLVR